MKFSGKFSKEATRTAAIATSVLASFVILAAFQNCSPVLPLDGVVDASSIAVRPTATPGGTPPTGIGTGSVYTGPQYDGVCTSSFADDPMALDGTDVAGGGLVAFNDSSGRAAFWSLSNGALSRGSVCYMNISGYTVQAIGDFDGDLNQDVLWRQSSTGNAVVWLMRGASRLQTAMVATIASTYNIEGTADFDGDGKDDLLLRDTSNGLVVMQMNGVNAPTSVSLGGTLTSAQSLTDISTYFDPAAGKKKIALFFKDSGATLGRLVWYMNGTSVANQATLPSGFTTTGTSTYDILGVGDFNGDYVADFLLQDRSTKNLRIRYAVYNSAGPTFAVYGDSAENLPPPAAWAFQGVQRINGDIYSDWLWIVSGGSFPTLGYTPVVNTPAALNSIGYIRSGYSLFKYSHR
jgi:hypothetical protein